MNKDNIVMLECYGCKKQIRVDLPYECADCFLKTFSQKIKPQSKWKKRKRFAYYVLFTGVPLWIVGMVFGFNTEIIAGAFLFIGWFETSLINFMTEKL